MGVALPNPALCLVTDRRVCPPDELPDRVSAAVAGGVDIVQLRDKDEAGGALLEQANALLEITSGSAIILINERADVAAACRAGGVQLGEAAMPTAAVRPLLPDGSIIGRSVHSVDGAIRAQASGADFLLVGTMFATRSHPGEEPSGPGLLERIRAAGASAPLLAIGGITADNVAQVMQAGADGAAVITAILASPDPEMAASQIKSAMLDAGPGGIHRPGSRYTTSRR
ncbi:MAG: thiamine phosphate synthase [Chloroflexota bacterium]|nr:thiamine phosphate synthase [Chloroflexota bacterium]MDE2958906.1 thiamine phosphate synthase [Chloroflexota bacterium]